MEQTAITVKNLKRTFVSYKREEGIGAAIKSLFKRDKVIKEAVKGVSFTINRGELVGFVGQNGAGKSTTIKMLTGVLHPSSGDIDVIGYTPWKERRAYVQHIGVVFGQKSQLWIDLPPQDAYALAKGIYKIPDKEYQERLAEMVKLLDIEEVIKRPVRKLSLGERMKCEFVMALLHNPKVLFLDEPTIGVDALAKEDIRTFLAKINKQYGTTIILTTHDMDDIEELCERIVIIDEGKLLYDGDLRKVKNQYVKWTTVDFEFKNIIKRSDFDKVLAEGVVQSNKGKYRSIRFDRKKHNVPQIINKLMKSCEIIDLAVHEPRLEHVIKEIYAERKT